MSNQTASGTVPQMAQVPRNMRLEREGADTVPYVAKYPRIIGGQCEWCGTLDSNVPGDLQYKLCPHYRGMDMKCGYCPREANPQEVLRSSNLKVYQHPDKPGVLVTCCSRTECEDKHRKRFTVSA